MNIRVAGLFADRETADRALSALQGAGFMAERSNAEQFESPEYYQGQLPQGRTTISVAGTDRGDEARRIMLGAGAMGVVDGEA